MIKYCAFSTSVLIVIFIINTIFIIIGYDFYIELLEIYLSSDKNISRPIYIIIKIQLVLLLFITLSHMISKSPNLFKNINLTILNKFFYSTVVVLFILFFASKFYYTDSIYSSSLIYKEDGLLEYTTFLLYLITSILLIMSFNIKKGILDIVVKCFLSFIFFIFSMEEISWGQRIFNFDTPDKLIAINYQNELNIHNIFNIYMDFLYTTFNLIIGIFLFNSYKIKYNLSFYQKINKYNYLIPSREYQLYGFIFIILGLQCALFDGGELTEEVFSIFGMAYAAEQLFIAKQPR